MEVGEILHQIRNLYLTKFGEELNDFGSDQDIVSEPALRDSNDNIAIEGFLEAGARIDVAVLSGETRMINFDFGEMISFKPVKFSWEKSLSVTLKPFPWDYAYIELIGEVQDWQPVKDWFNKWFKENPIKNSKLMNCVHFISDPEKTESGYQFFIDFGTAEMSALEELLDTAAKITNEIHIRDA